LHYPLYKIYISTVYKFLKLVERKSTTSTKIFPEAKSVVDGSCGNLREKVHVAITKIHADSKGKVAVDDVTLWANCCTKCHGNTISRFH